MATHLRRLTVMKASLDDEDEATVTLFLFRLIVALVAVLK